ncbi:uncharacterized protein [Ptychodera flava]|uniref:uncharacterized protein n=1 Tax=Ptychodera flava TaxID=63121 RepID=UPI00396A3791
MGEARSPKLTFACAKKNEEDDGETSKIIAFDPGTEAGRSVATLELSQCVHQVVQPDSGRRLLKAHVEDEKLREPLPNIPMHKLPSPQVVSQGQFETSIQFYKASQL